MLKVNIRKTKERFFKPTLKSLIPKESNVYVVYGFIEIVAKSLDRYFVITVL